MSHTHDFVLALHRAFRGHRLKHASSLPSSAHLAPSSHLAAASSARLQHSEFVPRMNPQDRDSCSSIPALEPSQPDPNSLHPVHLQPIFGGVPGSSPPPPPKSPPTWLAEPNVRRTTRRTTRRTVAARMMNGDDGDGASPLRGAGVVRNRVRERWAPIKYNVRAWGKGGGALFFTANERQPLKPSNASSFPRFDRSERTATGGSPCSIAQIERR